MNIYESKVIPEQVISEHIETVFSHVVCDLCGEKITDKKAFDGFEATVHVRVGENYPDGGVGEEIDFDICEKCAKELVIYLQSKAKQEVKWTNWGW